MGYDDKSMYEKLDSNVERPSRKEYIARRIALWDAYDDEPEDKAEVEADQAAEQIVSGNGIDAADLVTADSQPQGKAEANAISMENSISGSLAASKGGGQAMEDGIKSEMEGQMNTDLSDVRIHTDASANQMSEDINAKAFTHGQDVYFKDGNYDTQSTEGKNLLAHELVHTQQQGNGAKRRGQRQNDEPEEEVLYQPEEDFDMNQLLRDYGEEEEKKIFLRSSFPWYLDVPPGVTKAQISYTLTGNSEHGNDFEWVNTNVFLTENIIDNPDSITESFDRKVLIPETLENFTEEHYHWYVDYLRKIMDYDEKKLRNEYKSRIPSDTLMTYLIIRWTKVAHLKDKNGENLFDVYLKKLNSPDHLVKRWYHSDDSFKRLLPAVYDIVSGVYRDQISKALMYSSMEYSGEYYDSDVDVKRQIKVGQIVGRYWQRDGSDSWQIYVDKILGVYLEEEGEAAEAQLRSSNTSQARALIPLDTGTAGFSNITKYVVVLRFRNDHKSSTVGGFDLKERLRNGEFLWYHSRTTFMPPDTFDLEESEAYDVMGKIEIYKNLEPVLAKKGRLNEYELISTIYSLDSRALNSIKIDYLNELLKKSINSQHYIMKHNYQQVSGMYWANDFKSWHRFFDFFIRAISVRMPDEQEQIMSFLRENGLVSKIVDITKALETSPDIDKILAVSLIIGQLLEGQEDFKDEGYELDESYEYQLGEKINFYQVQTEVTIGEDGREYLILKAVSEQNNMFGDYSTLHTSEPILATTLVPVKIFTPDGEQNMYLSAIQLALFGQALSETLSSTKLKRDLMDAGFFILDIISLIAPTTALFRLLITFGIKHVIKYGAKRLFANMMKELISKQGRKILGRFLLEGVFFTIEYYRRELEKTEWGRKLLSLYSIVLGAILLNDLRKLARSKELFTKMINLGNKVITTIKSPEIKKGFKGLVNDIKALKTTFAVHWNNLEKQYAVAGPDGRMMLSNEGEKSFKQLYMSERLKLGKETISKKLAAAGKADYASKFNILSNKMDNIVSKNDELVKFRNRTIRKLEVMTPKMAAKYMDKFDELLATTRIHGGYEDYAIRMMAASFQYSHPLKILESVISISKRDIGSEALNVLAKKVEVETIDSIWLSKETQLTDIQLKFLAEDPQTPWKILKSKDPVSRYEGIIRGKSGEFVAIHYEVFRKFKVKRVQVPAGDSIIDIVYVDKSGLRIRPCEIKSWNLNRWKKNLKAYEKKTKGLPLDKREKYSAGQIETMFKQLKDAKLVVQGDNVHLLTSDAINNKKMYDADQELIDISETLREVLDDAGLSDVVVTYLREDHIKSVAKELKNAL